MERGKKGVKLSATGEVICIAICGPSTWHYPGTRSQSRNITEKKKNSFGKS